jgi:hypothetical protein
VMAVTRDTTLTALNRRWKTFQMETGKKLVVSSLYFLSVEYCRLVGICKQLMLLLLHLCYNFPYEKEEINLS